jgi:hypothetical protein
MAGGRPSKYSDELANEICSRIAGGLSLSKLCKMADMPNASTVFKWIGENPEFSNKYTKATTERAELMFDDMLEIADNENSEDTQRARLRVDTRKWALSKLMPKKYGDRQTVEHAGGISLTEMSEDELNRKLNELAKQASEN